MPRRHHKSCRVLLVEDQLLVREGIKALLQGLPELKVVGEAGNCAETLSLTEREQPDVIIISLQLAQDGALELLAELSRIYPPTNATSVDNVVTTKDSVSHAGTCKVIVLTAPIIVEECRRAIVLGAKGVVLK